jgi:hypothetical protein
MSFNRRPAPLPVLLCLVALACTSSARELEADANVVADSAPLAPDQAPPPDAAAPDLAGVDAAAADAPTAAEDTAAVAPDAAPASAGQYTCTLNATTPYHLGSEHRGYTVFGTVVDTTPGANRARVGAIQSTLDTNDLVKWVWPQILVAGHTYELAVFEDHLKNRTCAGTPTGEPQWLFKIPAVAGDFEFKWIQPVPHTASCQDFPPGPIP